MPDLRAVVPAVLLGEATAPADTPDQNESAVNRQGTPPPEAADSENGESAPGEQSSQCNARFPPASYISSMYLHVLVASAKSSINSMDQHAFASLDCANMSHTFFRLCFAASNLDCVLNLVVLIPLIINNAVCVNFSNTRCR